MVQRASKVGIWAMEIYFPPQFVAQQDLEAFDGASAGKYTIGLGQSALSFVNDREDIASVSLTCLKNLMAKNGIKPEQIGRLEVGTETLIDKAKSLKTVLMSLFRESGNHDVEGVTTVNACYGSTNALFNTFNWVESSAWDGRYGVVVSADIAVYPKGPARPTGGAGVICFLVGPNAPIHIEPVRATFIDNQYDFFKPNPRKSFLRV